ncbi:poly [ADP-ribose] polymerase 14 [Stegastes partitus]|uniref:Poly [ADP-ribose] polymerase n=1 Tax=Stegastes partitus TaxID=144197 RepID=A0A3B4ZWU4_9TELE|nr:PREDICTED: poly [ADP-ribose] polymerase 14-like [Stegastes partitus]
MDEFVHSLFFEAKDLTSKEKEKIRRYFQIKRESGGGECGNIEKVGNNIYKISFKDKEVQERVLQKKQHVVSLPDGEQCLLTVTSSPEGPDQPSTSQFQACAKGNTKGLEKIFKPDVFLLYYLRDNPKANKLLIKQLEIIGCTVDLDFDEEEAVVRGDIEKGPGGASGGAAEKWELQVDQVFINLTDRYLCHHVFDQKEIKMLLQDSSFANDDIIVYKESGYAVVVGEVNDVNEKIAALEKNLPSRKTVPFVEKQFKLVEEEFDRETRARFPEVKILKGSEAIILEGPDEEVQSAAAKLDELIKKIKEKRVQLSTPLLTFLTSSGAIAKYRTRFQQSLRNPVSIDVGVQLVLSSLSSDALDEAEAALSRDLSVVTVQLQGAAAVPPDLDRVKEILNKAKNDANSSELRVDVSFIPGPSGTTKVRLVGYSEIVNQLKEVLHDYQVNHGATQEVLNLPNPELVDCFDKILDLIGMKRTKVTLTASQFPNPCVLLSGPRCHVQEAKQALTAALASLTYSTLTLDGPGPQRYFQTDGKVSKELVESSCQVIIREKQSVHSPNVVPRPRSISNTPSIALSTGLSSTASTSVVNKPGIKLIPGSLEDEQVNVLVVPMLGKQLRSTKVGSSLWTKAGDKLKSNFDSAAANCVVAPGDVLQVDGPPSLGCSKIFFIECLPWDGVRGKSAQALSNGLKTCLDICAQKRFSSVALPVIGPGIVLKFPLREAVQVLTNSVCQFGLSASAGSISNIHIVIKTGYPDSEECYHRVFKQLSSNMNQGGQAIFRPLTSDLDDVTMTMGGGVKLQLVFGDITNETTDVVVNSTDFTNFDCDGVCKDILTVAGPEVQALLEEANVSRGEFFVSEPGQFHCKSIFHVCGEKDAQVIEELVCSIIETCELSGFQSVAIPAICAGTGQLDPGVVAGAILRGINVSTSSGHLQSLTDIRLVLIKINVFLAFKEEAMQMFSTAVHNKASSPWLRSLPPLPPKPQPQPSVTADLSMLHTSSASQQSVFQFLGLSKKEVDDAMEKLKNQYQAQCLTQVFKKEELLNLTHEDMQDLMHLLETEGLHAKMDSHGSLTVSGLKDGVSQVMQMINGAVKSNLERKMTVKTEEDLYSRVAWCILGQSGNWERVPKTANRRLENKDVAAGIVDTQGILWRVNLLTMEATTSVGQKTKLKRLENLGDFTLPLYWDSMTADEGMKVVTLDPSTAEYRTVKEAFKRTVTQAVMKIERLQNVHLRRTYEAQKKHIADKNGDEGGAGEMLLYHGTTKDNCDSIMKTGFNRSFAGQNATHFGHGTYFAANANYSAQHTYSRPADDGSQLMFVARVLTGVYTQGHKDMKVPPPRNSQVPHDRYDSLVNATNNPSIFVVFHDNQAYPDYLITFK